MIRMRARKERKQREELVTFLVNMILFLRLHRREAGLLVAVAKLIHGGNTDIGNRDERTGFFRAWPFYASFIVIGKTPPPRLDRMNTSLIKGSENAQHDFHGKLLEFL